MSGSLHTSNRRRGTVDARINRGAHPGSIRLLVAEAQRDVACVTEATDGREAYRLAMEHKPDIVLLDVDLPDLDVESITTRIRHHLPDTKVLLLARYEEDARIVAAMQAGAFGYILKDTDQTDFLHIIRATVHREQALSPLTHDHIVRTVPGAVRQPHEERATLLLGLTEREQEILACASVGRSNKEIADQLCVSVDTVKTHLHHIYQKLSVDGRVEAILAYLRA
jgi:DNA-binding NarL/FixJ family response regulator